MFHPLYPAYSVCSKMDSQRQFYARNGELHGVSKNYQRTETGLSGPCRRKRFRVDDKSPSHSRITTTEIPFPDCSRITGTPEFVH